MSIVLVAVAGVLAGTGTFLVTARTLSRIVLGFVLLGHAAVIALIASGGEAGAPPVAPVTERVADPLPQALSLTAIVISFGLTVFLLALAVRQRVVSGDDLVEDDIEDRRVAAGATRGEGGVDERGEADRSDGLEPHPDTDEPSDADPEEVPA